LECRRAASNFAQLNVGRAKKLGAHHWCHQRAIKRTATLATSFPECPVGAAHDARKVPPESEMENQQTLRMAKSSSGIAV
jgi:hypothetical protein